MSNNNESSLTTPSDRDLNNKWKPNQFEPPLNNDELKESLNELSDKSALTNFRQIDRTYVDPPVNLQSYSLFSFMPAKGASPNENGIYGFAKIRGSYASELEAQQRAEYLIRNVDSYNKIFHCYTGRPFPITTDSKYSATTDEIDIRKEMVKTVSQNIKEKKDEEYKVMNEIKRKEEELLADTKKEQEDPYESYITQKVKCAQLMFTYDQHRKKMAEVKNIIIKTKENLKELDEQYPEFKDKYFEKYMEARRQAGLKDDENSQDNFIRFMVEDLEL
jgi:hypothetical protein